MRIGIFGGTFNPPHLGHLVLAQSVQESLALDSILFVPAAVPPHKIDAPEIAADEHRVAMLVRAVQDNSCFDISLMEIDRAGISFTIDTVRALAATYAGAELFLMIGADNLADFHTWRDPDGICALAHLVVMQRAGFSPSDVDPRWRSHIVPVRTPIIEISGTDIRRRVREGRSIRYLVPEGVAEYIASNALYR